MKKRLYISAVALAVCFGSQAQNVREWTLEECIDYAIENNINLKQRELEQKNREIELNTNKNAWLPNLNMNAGHNFDFGRSPSKTGVIVDQNSTNTSASLQLSMPLFDGFRIINNIAAGKLNFNVATENLNKAKEDLSVNVASLYLQVLYNKELLKIAEMQLNLTTEQILRTDELVKTGRVPLSQLYDIKAQQAKDEVVVVESKNSLSMSMLDLTQALELEREGAFDIEEPEVGDVVEMYMNSILPPANIYDNAVAFKPQIKAQEYQLESQKKMLKVAQSAYYPMINLNASYSNGYYRYSGNNATNIGFGDQIRQNERKTIGFSLSIPIFNRFQTRNNVRSARVGIRNQELMMDNVKKALYKEIQQAYFSATAAQKKYMSSKKAVDAGNEAYSYAEERYKAGKSSVFEYDNAKAKYTQSLSEQLRAKYEFIFRAKILDFYNGIPIKL